MRKADGWRGGLVGGVVVMGVVQVSGAVAELSAYLETGC